MWKFHALLSAFFASLTAIYAQVGVKRHPFRLHRVGALLITSGSMVILIK